MTTGLGIVLTALIVTLAFGGYRRLTDGRAKVVAGDRRPRLDGARLGADLGREATLVQFSSSVCAPCTATHSLLADVVQGRPGVSHIDLDAETRLDLLEEFGITRTPTVLLLDASGAVRHRLVGAARRRDVVGALDRVAGHSAGRPTRPANN